MGLSRRAVLWAGIGLAFARRGASAQARSRSARLGYLATGEHLSPLHEEFRAALRGHGWTEGENLVVEYRFAGGNYERLRGLAADLVRAKVDVIFASNAPAAAAAKEATRHVPIVFHTLNDPVRAGLVSSLGRPGGNMTGNAGLGPELDRKRIELLKEVLPKLATATILMNPRNPMSPPRLVETEDAARALKVQLRVLRAADAKALNTALQAIASASPEALIVFDDPVFFQNWERIIGAANAQRVPTVYSQSGWAERGGLMEYAPDQREMFRQAAGYVDRILRGAKPGDLPIAQPTKFDLVINANTARMLGVTIPPSLRLRAERVIE